MGQVSDYQKSCADYLWFAEITLWVTVYTNTICQELHNPLPPLFKALLHGQKENYIITNNPRRESCKHFLSD
jgi:hypothetical protein